MQRRDTPGRVPPPAASELENLARSLRLLHSFVEDVPSELAGQVLRAAAPPASRVRGPRQEAILALPDMATAAGLRPTAIATLIDYSVSNTYNLLRSLGRAGLTELVEGSQPQRWRLTSGHRHNASVFGRLARAVRRGEWTTCADISIASRGDTSASWMVCWAAATLPDFPGPHRVLLEGGFAHPSGHDHGRAHPEQVMADLAREGVRFTAPARADAASRVTWDELRERSRA